MILLNYVFLIYPTKAAITSQVRERYRNPGLTFFTSCLFNASTSISPSIGSKQIEVNGVKGYDSSKSNVAFSFVAFLLFENSTETRKSAFSDIGSLSKATKYRR
mmetsp:Transcript_356/g.523  ORF Transcript_356/g.523 Transcript_356/m.523 type:complete len:104 (+) Transcript_356:2712-3023(+)